MKVTIKHLRFQHMFGRLIAYGQLYDETDKPVVRDSPLSNLLAEVHEVGAEITNAQEILDTLVRINGIGV